MLTIRALETEMGHGGRWFRDGSDVARKPAGWRQANAEGFGAEAYREARERERDVILPDATTVEGLGGAE
jgi:hypothetical protein